MSAYMVDRNHIRYLVEAAIASYRHYKSTFRWIYRGAILKLDPGDPDRAAAVGQMLWDENRKSIEYRYEDTRKDFSRAPGPVGESFVYDRHKPVLHERFDPVQVLKSCDCYEYQACEHPGWKDSEAKAFVNALRNHYWHHLPGYDQAEWGAPAEPR